jgi:hypothetical protein
MAAVTVDLSAPGAPITGDQVRTIAGILGLDHVEFTDIQRIDIAPSAVTVTVLHRDEDGDIATVTIVMPIRWA